MVRVICLAGLATLLMAATPLTGSLRNGFVYQEATIAPLTGAAVTVAPAQPAPTDYTPAPVPDFDQAAPTLRTLGPEQPELRPGLFSPTKTYRGEGYTPGSTVQGSQERHVHPAPGFSLNVPLQ